MAKRFQICEGKGFHINFPNGITLSTQFGPGNYADVDRSFEAIQKHYDDTKAVDCNAEANTPEIAVINEDDFFITKYVWSVVFPDREPLCDNVVACVSWEDWKAILDYLSS